MSTSKPLHLPLLDDAASAETKPLLRGWLHLGTLPVAIVSGLVLVALAQGTLATWTSLVFALSSILLFGISATYHRINWSPRVKLIFKRIDHANIFLLIAGTYTPLGALALPPEKGWWLLLGVWIGAGLGIGFRVFWVGAPRWVYVPLYLILGWVAMVYMVDLWMANASMTILVIVGGVAYTAGAIVYALKKPNPVPGVFGFHEVFHAFTVIAFLCHWSAVLLIALAPLNT